MGFIRNLAEAWRAAIDRKRQQTEKYRIEYAFTSGGTKYYQFADINNLPYERGLTALCVYNEVEMRCSRQHLIAHVDAMEKILHQKEIDIYKIKALNDSLKQRLMLKADVELLYRLASVCFFDKTENPSVYEPEYAAKKIAKWRKDQKVAAFFSQKPLLELMPFLRSVEVDLDTYTQMNEEFNKIQQEVLRLASSTHE